LSKRLFFAGAETASVYGGYMDRAIHSGLLAAKSLAQKSNDAI